MWPSRWFTPMNGTSRAAATALAAAIPTRSAPTRPGPTVTATASMSFTHIPASVRAMVMSGLMFSRWAREATSGTTPPNFSWRCTWLARRFERMVRPSSTTATAVSSHEVSIPRTRIASVRPHPVGDLPHDAVELQPVLRRADAVGPHHHRVLAGLLVVVLADAHRAEPEPAVEALRSPVRHPDLQGHRHGSHAEGLLHQVVQQPRPDLVAVVGGVDRDV